MHIQILDSYFSTKPINPFDILSIREIQVARLLIKGSGNLEIMEQLNIKKTTVSTYKYRIFEKMQIDNLTRLIELFNLYSEDKWLVSYIVDQSKGSKPVY